MESLTQAHAVDAKLANAIGPISDDLLASSHYDYFGHFRDSLLASRIADSVFRAIKEHGTDDDSAVAAQVPSRLAQQYSTDIQNVLRVFRVERHLGIVGVLVLRDETDPAVGATPVDIFNQLALEGLLESPAGLQDVLREVSRAKPGSTRWSRAMMRVLPELHPVRQVDERTATQGFLTRLAESMRALLRGYLKEEETHILFKVRSGDGYQIRSYEVCRYSPLVFGAKKSSPVEGWLRSGIYKFEGWKDGEPTTDKGRYPVDPDHREAEMDDF